MEKSNSKKKIIYGVHDKMPLTGFILTSLQHMLLCVSVGLALPIAVASAAGLDVAHSSSYLSATLFGMGLVSIFQSLSGRYLGSGYLSMAVSDSVAIGCCVLAAETGGIPMVLGVSLCACAFKFVFGHFTFRLRRLFPAEATGTMVLLLGINLIPTAFKYFLGTAAGFNLTAFIIACLTLLVMIICTFFIKFLKPYSALVGIVFGYILSIITGIFDINTFSSIGELPVISLPIYTDISYSFSIEHLWPFLVIALASVIDNIGDFSATQAAADPDMKKPDWKSIERGIRAEGLANGLAVLMGGSLLSTATANIGVSRATGVVCRNVAFLASGFLMLAAFFPGLTGILSMIPAPVLGAVIMYSTCYILSSGFASLQKIELDDKKIISIFLAVAAGISTLIPGLYDFLPENVKNILISPLVIGVVLLVITITLGKIGTKKHYEFTTGVSQRDIPELMEQISDVCKKWGTERVLSRKLQIATSGLCEALYEIDPNCKLSFNISYDSTSVMIKMETAFQNEKALENEALSFTVKMLEHMFDSVKSDISAGSITIKMDEDL